jgi:hypothetical protein
LQDLTSHPATFGGVATPIETAFFICEDFPRTGDDRGAGVKEAVALATRLGVKPESNATSKSLQEGHLKHAQNVQAQLGGHAAK